MEKNPHHLILGELSDFLSGEARTDTHDERYRQKISKYLVQTLGYEKHAICQNENLIITAGNQRARIIVDFLIDQDDKTCMLIKYAPGSLVTRRLSNLALSRVIRSYQVPVIVTTNGEDAEIISGLTGKLTGQGLEAIPSKLKLENIIKSEAFPAISDSMHEKASRIAYACEVDGACPCDTDVCLI
jgi:Type I restriction enzyme R protein N terminus (HSDR_N)